MLMIGCKSAQLMSGQEQDQIEDEYGNEDPDEQKTKNLWTEEEVEKLIEAVAEHQNDWQVISKEVFEDTKSPDQCVQKFLELPITENMMAKISSRQ